MADLIKMLKRQFAYIVVDTGSILDELTISILDTVDEVFLVTTQDIPSINDIRRTLDLAPSIGIDPQSVSLLLNQYHTRVNITVEKITSNLGRDITAVLPLDSPIVVPSINQGVPFMSSRKGRSRPSRVSQPPSTCPPPLESEGK